LEPEDVITVAVTSGMPATADIGAFCLEFSFYCGNLDAYMGALPLGYNPVLVRLLKNLEVLQGPPLIRIGGGSVNATWYNPDGFPRPAGISYDLTPDYLDVVEDTLMAAGSSGIFCPNVGIDDLSVSENMASGILTHIDQPWIAGFEVGNDPNRYEPNGRRSSDYDFDAFVDEFDAFLTACETNVSNVIPALGPTFTMTSAETVGEDEEWNACAPGLLRSFKGG
jgi:hypothetical protein